MLMQSLRSIRNDEAKVFVIRLKKIFFFTDNTLRRGIEIFEFLWLRAPSETESLLLRVGSFT
ncbi:MAG: hypothetical protein C0390_12690 [Syntrophus sp. (in: bacteria)]|nr:hypothetical protein [Syntrophus sp. (in: bacteria)]